LAGSFDGKSGEEARWAMTGVVTFEELADLEAVEEPPF
jgi:hypothetical protein